MNIKANDINIVDENNECLQSSSDATNFNLRYQKLIEELINSSIKVLELFDVDNDDLKKYMEAGSQPIMQVMNYIHSIILKDRQVNS